MPKVFTNSKLHPAIIQGQNIRAKMIKHLTAPKREDYDREQRFQAALRKHRDYVARLTKVIVIVIREHIRACAKAELYPNTEFLHSICLTKLYCIMAGGGRYVQRSADDPTMRIVPLSSTYNDDVRIIVEAFFDHRLRGTNRTGSSKWTPKQVPKFGSEFILSLLLIYEENKAKFDVILEFLKKSDSDEEGIFEDEFIFEISETVSEQISERLLNVINP